MDDLWEKGARCDGAPVATVAWTESNRQNPGISDDVTLLGRR
jgi:hypothetical protein